jgi:hypothetical protein
MNKYDEIKKLVEASRRALSSTINENLNGDIRNKYKLLNEQDFDTDVEVEDKYGEEKDLVDKIGEKKDKQKGFKILGNTIVLHGKSKADLQLTTDEKNAFTTTIDEFREEVAELAEFGRMNVYPDNVEWSGKIMELDIEFFFNVNEPHGIYIKGEMIKVNQEYLEMVGKLQNFYEKFKNKWSKIIASRQEDI